MLRLLLSPDVLKPSAVLSRTMAASRGHFRALHCASLRAHSGAKSPEEGELPGVADSSFLRPPDPQGDDEYVEMQLAAQLWPKSNQKLEEDCNKYL